MRNKVTTVKRVLDRASYFYQSNGHFLCVWVLMVGSSHQHGGSRCVCVQRGS